MKKKPTKKITSKRIRSNMENLSSKSKLPYTERYNEAKKEYDETILKIERINEKS